MGSTTRRPGPFGKVPASDRRPLLAKSIGAMVAVGSLMASLERKMKATGGPGIVPLELAGDRGAIDAILSKWGPSGRSAARESLVLDQAWLVTYALSLAVSAAEAADAFEGRGWRSAASAGASMGWGALAAGALDAVENASLLAVVNGSASTRLPRLAQRCAQVKFALVAASLPYGLTGIAVGALDRRRSPVRL